MRKRFATAVITLGSLIFLTSTGHLTTAQRHKAHKRSPQLAADRWYTFTSPDRDFTLAFPRAPKRQQDEQGSVTLIRSYNVTTDEGMHFSINFQDIGGDPRSRQNNEFAPDHEAIVTAAAREQGRRMVQVRRLAKNVVEMEYRMTMQETKADINYLERTILRRGRLYSVSCGSVADGGEANRYICRRFFNSMRFLK